MKSKLQRLASLFTAAAMMLCAAPVVPASAASDGVTIDIDDVELTLSELEAMNYQVPVYVRMTENAGISAAEFGIRVDSACSYEVITHLLDAEELGGEYVLWSMTYASNEELTWQCWIHDNVDTQTGSIIMYYITVPEDAQVGDIFSIEYVEEISKTHIWNNDIDGVNHVENGTVDWDHGSITIIPDSHTVTYDSNGAGYFGGAGEETCTVTINSDETFIEPDFYTYRGIYFEGWTLEDGTPVDSTDTPASLGITGDVTLYASFKRWVYTYLYFDANGGECSTMGGNIYYYGETLDFYGSLPVPTRDGYEFLGWYTEDGTLATESTRIDDLYNSLPVEELTLYAKWGQPGTSIIFDANGGTCAESSREVVLGEACGELPVPVRENYTFAGWFTESGTEITAETLFTTEGTITLYAKWIGDTYMITFDADGGTAEFVSKFVEYGSYYAPFPAVEKEGFTFVGWFTEDGIQVADDDLFLLTEDITLYAHWEVEDICGDVDRNGTVNIIDVITLTQATMGAVPLTKEQALVADCNSDSVISPNDALCILQLIVGLVDSLPVTSTK